MITAAHRPAVAVSRRDHAVVLQRMHEHGGGTGARRYGGDYWMGCWRVLLGLGLGDGLSLGRGGKGRIGPGLVDGPIGPSGGIDGVLDGTPGVGLGVVGGGLS